MDYEHWNRVIVDHFVQQRMPGSPIHLTVDDDLLSTIGAREGMIAEAAVGAFRDDVRSRVAVPGRGEVSLDTLRGRDNVGRPRGVAFLALMVLAAYRMGDGDWNESNYFAQFRDLLRLSGHHHGRPHGMDRGAEEPLWRDWNRYLLDRRLLPTARRGEGIAYKYINYPRSQTLLRIADQDRLKRLFGEAPHFLASIGPDLLMARLIAQRDHLTAHLQECLQSRGDQYAALSERIHELHEDWLPRHVGSDRNTTRREDGILPPTTIAADLIRLPTLGGSRPCPPLYYLVPRLKRSYEAVFQRDDDRVEINGEWVPIEMDSERPGSVLPIDRPLSEEQIVRGAGFPLRHADPFTEIRLTRRPFHLLLQNPDFPQIFETQSSRQISPGVHFVLIGPETLEADMNLLKTKKKVGWRVKRPFGETGWQVWEDCMVLDQRWSGAGVENDELNNALRPRSSVSVGLSGGLRALGGFMAGVPPVVTVRGTRPVCPFEIRQMNETTEKLVFQGELSEGQPFPFPAKYLTAPAITC